MPEKGIAYLARKIRVKGKLINTFFLGSLSASSSASRLLAPAGFEVLRQIGAHQRKNFWGCGL